MRRGRQSGTLSSREARKADPTTTTIRVFGVGGVGGRLVGQLEQELRAKRSPAAGRRVRPGLKLSFHYVDTDAGSRRGRRASPRTYLEIEAGPGAGKDPDLAAEAARAHEPELTELFADVDIAFILGSFAGGTGGGVSPILGGIARDAGCLSVVLALEPFRFEGELKAEQARTAMTAAAELADAVVPIPCGRCLQSQDGELPLEEAFAQAGEEILGCLRSLTGMFLRPGQLELDLGDARRLLSRCGYAAIGRGSAEGEGSVPQALRNACTRSFLTVEQLEAARGVLLCLSGGSAVRLDDIGEMAATVQGMLPDVPVLFGLQADSAKDGRTVATILAAGLDESVAGMAALPDPSELLESPAKLGVFPASDASYYEGENLDIPTFLRRASGRAYGRASRPRRRRQVR